LPHLFFLKGNRSAMPLFFYTLRLQSMQYRFTMFATLL
jgi:hypothetical protein